MQRAFLEVGSNAVMAPTRRQPGKVAAYGLQDRVEEIHLKLVTEQGGHQALSCFSRRRCLSCRRDDRAHGDLTFDELYDIYLEQIRALKKTGVDFYRPEAR